MAKAKVRHGLITWPVEIDGRLTEEVAFRGMTVDLPQDQYDRLLALSAIIPAKAELDQPGKMMGLSPTASNEEILQWAMSAKESEIESLAMSRPELADRLRVAHEVVKERLEQQNEHLGGVLSAAERGAEQAKAAQDLEQQRLRDAGKLPPEADPEGLEDDGEEEELEPTEGEHTIPEVNADGTITMDVADYDAVVRGSNRKVQGFLSKHPTHAQAVLEAENRRVEAARAADPQSNEQPRSGVIRAVEAAVAHTAQ